MENGRRPSQLDISRRAFIFAVPTLAAIYGRRYPNVQAAEDILLKGLGSLAHDALTGSLTPSAEPSIKPAADPKPPALPIAQTVEASGDRLSLNVVKYPWNDRVPPVAQENWQAKYITMHFTVGPAVPNRVDLTSYHYVFGADGAAHECQSTVRHQAPPPGQKDIVEWQMYAPHTSYANTRNVGLSMCGAMTPNDQKNIPVFTPKSLDSMLKMAAFQAKSNNISIDKDHIKTHYQWAQYFKQKGIKTENVGKTDITRIPWMPELNTPEKVHEYLLGKIANYAKYSIQVNYV